MKQPKENSTIDLSLAGSIAKPLPDNREHIVIRLVDPIMKVVVLSVAISVGILVAFMLGAIDSGTTKKSKSKKKKKGKVDSVELIDHAINNFDDQML